MSKLRNVIVAAALLGPSAHSAVGRTNDAHVSAPTTVDSLRERVTRLESQLANTTSMVTQSSSVVAPFTVVDKAGVPLFTVTDEPFAVAKKGRVHIGRGSGTNYATCFLTSAGAIAVSIGEAKAGGGLVQVNKGGNDIASLSEDGFIANNAAGKQVAHLGADPTNRERARLVVRGVFEFQDAKFATVIDGGALPDGRGAIRTWPNNNCKAYSGLRSPTCLMGSSAP